VRACVRACALCVRESSDYYYYKTELEGRWV